MNNYFYNMVDPDEMATLEYIPTIPKFLKFLEGLCHSATRQLLKWTVFLQQI